MNFAGDTKSVPGTVVVVAGPTAAGKSELALSLAQELDGEIINADSMQLYRGMDIGTAKLTENERRGIPHHLLDIWNVTYTANVAQYQALARRTVDDIVARGKTPVLVGGSGLYIQAVVDVMEFPGTDAAIRARLETELQQYGAEAMHSRLRNQDPAAAEAILPTNGRRIVRALEVVALTGSFTARLPSRTAAYSAVFIGVDRRTEELDARIQVRAERMWQQGLVEEVVGLLEHGIKDAVTASKALGYRQVLDFLDGVYDEQEALRKTITGTRRFVRRQRSWFGRDDRITWLDAAEPNLSSMALDVVEDRLATKK